MYDNEYLFHNAYIEKVWKRYIWWCIFIFEICSLKKVEVKDEVFCIKFYEYLLTLC